MDIEYIKECVNYVNTAPVTSDIIEIIEDYERLLAEREQLLEQQVEPLKDHQISEAINAVRDVAVAFAGTQQLRERIAAVLRPVLRTAKPSPAVAVPEFTDAAWNAMSEAMESQGYSASKNDLDRDDYKALFDAAIQSAPPSPSITEQDTGGLLPLHPVDHPDCQVMLWSEQEIAAIKDYAKRCIAALPQRVTEQDALEIIEAYSYWEEFESHRDSGADQWLKEESGSALLNKLNANAVAEVSDDLTKKLDEAHALGVVTGFNECYRSFGAPSQAAAKPPEKDAG